MERLSNPKRIFDTTKFKVLNCARRGTVPDTYAPHIVEAVLKQALDNHKKDMVRHIALYVLLSLAVILYKTSYHRFDWFIVGQLTIFLLFFGLAERMAKSKYQAALYFAQTNEQWRARAGKDIKEH